MTGPMCSVRVTLGHRRQFGDADGWNRFHDDVGRHDALLLDDLDPRLDPSQPDPVGEDLGLEFGPAQPQHAVQFRDPDLVVEDLADLLEGESEILQGDEPVEAAELGRLVGAVARRGVHAGGGQQAERVVVAQHAHRHAADSGEVSNAVHDASRTIG